MSKVDSSQNREGLTKSVAIKVAASGVRVNAVASGPTDGVLDRFTGGGEGNAFMASGGPLKRI
jgi:NAD(P)-dependent dehydrogenase (short-subunit alcohol dehydrogenase family)